LNTKDYLFDRTMKKGAEWAAEDKARHQRAWAKLLESGYVPADTKGVPDVALDETPNHAE
jgi:hypothetical protein